MVISFYALSKSNPSPALLSEEQNVMRYLATQQKQSMVQGERYWESVKQFSEQLNAEKLAVSHYKFVKRKITEFIYMRRCITLMQIENTSKLLVNPRSAISNIIIL